MKWISILTFLMGLLPQGTPVAQGNVGAGITIPHVAAILDLIVG